MFDHATMRKRFANLGAMRDAILAKADPIRARRDALAAETDAELRRLATELREAEAGLFEIDMERSTIAQVLKGKTGASGV